MKWPAKRRQVLRWLSTHYHHEAITSHACQGSEAGKAQMTHNTEQRIIQAILTVLILVDIGIIIFMRH